jgi:hypothetical protein
LKFADLTKDEDLLVEAQHRARSLIEIDPGLKSPEAQPIVELLGCRYADRLELFSAG